jgi:TonB family protein
MAHKQDELWSRLGARAASALLHAALLGWLLWAPAPDILKVNPVMRGNGGTSVEIVYSGSERGATERAAFEPRRLTVPPPAPPEKASEAPPLARHPDLVADESRGTPARAGSPTGSSIFGEFRGRDVRPAIPMAWADPEVFPWQVVEEGRVVVEITIDAQGNVTSAKVIESLHRAIDEKVLEAAWKWRFRPATVDGVPIASRQDLVFRFPS